MHKITFSLGPFFQIIIFTVSFVLVNSQNATVPRNLPNNLAQTSIDGWCLADNQLESSRFPSNTALGFNPCDFLKFLGTPGRYPSFQWASKGTWISENTTSVYWEGNIANRHTKKCLKYEFGNGGSVIGVPIPPRGSQAIVGNLSTTTCSFASGKPTIAQAFRFYNWTTKYLITTADTTQACQNKAASLETSFGRVWLGCSNSISGSAMWDIGPTLLRVAFKI